MGASLVEVCRELKGDYAEKQTKLKTYIYIAKLEIFQTTLTFTIPKNLLFFFSDFISLIKLELAVRIVEKIL